MKRGKLLIYPLMINSDLFNRRDFIVGPAREVFLTPDVRAGQ